MFRSATKALSAVKLICKETIILIFGFIVLIGLVILYTTSIPVFLLRILVNKAAKFFRPDLKSIVCPQGNLFSVDIFSSKSPRCAIVVPFILEGHLTEAVIKERFSIMVNAKDKATGKKLYPEYTQYVEQWFGFAFWRKDPHFDMRNHVKLYTSADCTCSVQELCDLVEELLNKRFEPPKSPWEAYILNNYHDPDLPDGIKTVVVMRVHHTLADGFSILYSLIEGFLQVPISSILLPTPTYARRDKWSTLWFNATFPARLMHDVGEYFIKGMRKNPFNVPDSKKSWNQFYGRAKPFPIQKIKYIKDRLGVTFTSVLLGAVSASLSVLTKTKVAKEDESIERASFFIPLPMPRHPNSLTIHVTGAQIDLPMQSFSNPTLRVRDCDRQLAKQKASTIPWLLQFLAKTLGQHFSAVCGVLSANRVNIAGLTSFPVGSNEIKLGFHDGKVLSVELATGGLIGISGLAFMAISYGKNICFSVTAESSVLTKRDVDRLLTLLVEEIDVLHEIAASQEAFTKPELE